MGFNKLAAATAAVMTLIVSGISKKFYFYPQKYREENITDVHHLQTLAEELPLEHWLPDWYNQSNIGLVLDERVREIRKRCKSYNGNRNDWKDSPKKRLARSKNLVYCHTAKAGSTFWRKLLKRVKLEEMDQRHALKITTMRNPWHRLVSTYIQKFEEQTGMTLKIEMQKFCYKVLLGKLNFKEFVKKCVIRPWKNNKYNIHWLPTTERCDVCGDNFDYIVAVENMALESNYVLEKAGLENPEQIFKNTRSDTIRRNEKNNTSADYQSYYIDMDVEDIKALQRIYEFDIYVLQYPKTPFVDFENS